MAFEMLETPFYQDKHLIFVENSGFWGIFLIVISAEYLACLGLGKRKPISAFNSSEINSLLLQYRK